MKKKLPARKYFYSSTKDGKIGDDGTIASKNNLIYLVLARVRRNKRILIGIVYLASSNRLSSFVHHVVGDVKSDAQEKLFVLTKFSGFIGLCRFSII